MEKYFFSKNYKETKSAGNKAKTDIEEILLTNGYKNPLKNPAGLYKDFFNDL